MSNSVTVGVRFAASDRGRLQAEASARGISMAALVRGYVAAGGFGAVSSLAEGTAGPPLVAVAPYKASRASPCDGMHDPAGRDNARAGGSGGDVRGLARVGVGGVVSAGARSRERVVVGAGVGANARARAGAGAVGALLSDTG